MFTGFNIEGLEDDGESHRVRIAMGNVTSSIVCPPFLLKQLSEAFSYQIVDADRIRDHKVAFHMKEASKAAAEGDKRQETYHREKAENAQDWNGVQTLFQDNRIGTGMVEDLIMWLEYRGHSVEIVDNMKKGPSVTIPKRDLYMLRNDQQKAMDSLREVDFRGIVHASTAFGKTVLATNVIHYLQTPTVIIADKKIIVEQWVDAIENSLDLDTKKIPGASGYYFYSDHHDKPVIMLGSSSLIRSSQNKVKTKSLQKRNHLINNILSNAGLMIYDECHHAASGQGKLATQLTKAYHRVGLSATVNMREDGKDPEYLSYIGQVCFFYPPTKLVDMGHGKRVIVRPLVVNYKRGELEIMREEVDSYEELYDNFINHNVTRNKAIAAAAMREAMMGNTVLVLIDRLDQARSLVLGMGQKLAAFTWGEDTDEMRAEKLERFRTGEIPILVCTHQLAGEGFDVSRINRLFLTGGSAEGKTYQAIGRIMRKSEHREGILYDVVDPIAPFSRHFLDRLDVYQSEDAFVLEDNGRTLPRWAQNYLW